MATKPASESSPTEAKAASSLAARGGSDSHTIDIPSYASLRRAVEQSHHAVTIDNVNRILASHGRRCIHIRFLADSGGVINQVYMITTVPTSDTTSPVLPSSSTSNDDNADMVLRLGSPHPYWKSAKTLNDVLYLRMVARYTTIPVARVIAFELNSHRSPFGSEYIIMTRIAGIPANRAFGMAKSRLTPQQLVHARAAYHTQLCEYVNELHAKMPRPRGIGALTAIPITHSTTTTTTSVATDHKQQQPHQHRQWFDEVITISDDDIVRAVYDMYDMKVDDTSRVCLSLTGVLQDGATIGPFESPLDELIGNLHWCIRVIESAPHLISFRYLIPSLTQYGVDVINRVAKYTPSSSPSSPPTSDGDLTSIGVSMLAGIYGRVWSHCDLNSSNILVQHDTLKITAVLDWEKAHIASPWEDGESMSSVGSDDAERASWPSPLPIIPDMVKKAASLIVDILVGVRGICFYLPTWTQRQWYEADDAAASDASHNDHQRDAIRRTFYDTWMNEEALTGVKTLTGAFTKINISLPPPPSPTAPTAATATPSE